MQASVQVPFFGTIQNYSTKNSSVQTYTYISTTFLFFKREKTARSVMPYSKLLSNGCEVEKTFNMTKFRIFDSYPTVYYLPYFDKLLKKSRSKSNLTVFEFEFKPQGIRKTFMYKKVAHFP